MSQLTSAPQEQLMPRRSLRLRNLNAPRGNQETSKLLQLSFEVRQLIFSHLVSTEHPFMIGRSQEKRRGFLGSPRDIFTFHTNSKFKVRRDERKCRPIQPAISRVCRALREESLPLWYCQNEFWLIHNEFEPEDSNDGTPLSRGFDAWLSQTPAARFDLMQHVSICCYASWPNRMMISLDLKNRKFVSIRHYSTYGDDLPIYQESIIDATKAALGNRADADGLTALEAVLEVWRHHFRIPRQYFTSPRNDEEGACVWMGIRLVDLALRRSK